LKIKLRSVNKGKAFFFVIHSDILSYLFRDTDTYVLQGFVEPSSEKLLPDLAPNEQHVFTVVLDLNDTLVHSDWKVKLCFQQSLESCYLLRVLVM
jgi:hypothetical protein